MRVLLGGCAGLFATAASTAAERPDAGRYLGELETRRDAGPEEWRDGARASRLPPLVERRASPASPAVPPSRAADAASAADGAAPTLAIRAIRLVGLSAIDPALLAPMLDAQAGRTMTVDALRALADALTRRLRDLGLPLARVSLPPQEVRDGVVRMDVAEGRLARVELDNATDVDDAVLQRFLEPLRRTGPPTQAALERALLLLGDLPGIAVAADLRPSAMPGAADLWVQVAANPAPAWQVVADNHGSAITGRERLSAVAVAGRAADAGIALATTLTLSERLGYVGQRWQVPVDGDGHALTAAWSAMRYRLGGAFEALQAGGSAVGATLGGRHLLHRGLDRNAALTLQWSERMLVDGFGSGAGSSSRQLSMARLGLELGARRSDPDGRVDVEVGYSAGRRRAEDGGSADPASRRFAAWEVSLGARLATGRDTAVLASARGQRTASVLDAAERLGLGGAQGVRAYGPDAAQVDSGYVASLEWAWEPASAPAWLFAVFVDRARGARLGVAANAASGAASSRASRAALDGVGLRLRWSPDRSLSVSLAVAQAVDRDLRRLPSTGPRIDLRIDISPWHGGP